MADLNVNITVVGGGGSGVGEQVGFDTQLAKENAKVAFDVTQAVRVAQRVATQASARVSGSIGTFTGNKVLERRIETVTGTSSRVMGVGLAFAANPSLGAVAAVGEAIDLAFSAAKTARQREWANAQAAQLAKRAGYLSNENRGRSR